MARLAIKPVKMFTDQKTGSSSPDKRRFARWGIAAAAGFLVCLAGAVAALPSLVNQETVRQKIEAQIEAWSGLPIKVNGSVKLAYFPGIHAELSDVTSLAPLEQISFQAKTVSADVPFASILSGNLGWSNLSIADAQIIFRPKAGGHVLPFSGSQLFKPAISQASAALTDNREEPDLSNIENLAVGSITLARSSLTVIWASGREDRFTEVNGFMNWPRLRSAGSVSGDGLWRGEKIEAKLKIAQPLAFAAGGASHVSLAVTSAPASFKFDGETNLAADFFAGGTVSLHAPSLGAALGWVDMPVSAASGLGALDLTAMVTSADRIVKLDNVELSLGGSPATGTLEIDADGDPARLGGTLAFASLDLGGLVGGGTASAAEASNEPTLDLRLSAETAMAGGLALTDVAGAIRNDSQGMRLDLGNAALGGGTVSASLVLSNTGGSTRAGDFKLAGRAVSPAKFDIWPDGLPVLDGTMDFDLALSGPYTDARSFLSGGSGTLSIKAGEATLRNFSAAAFTGKVRDGKIFPLPEAFAGLTAIKSVAVDATLSKGLAMAESCEIVTDGERITLAGAIPFDFGGVALNGMASKADGSDLIPFFVGGRWDKPFVTTLPDPK